MLCFVLFVGAFIKIFLRVHLRKDNAVSIFYEGFLKWSNYAQQMQ